MFQCGICLEEKHNEVTNSCNHSFCKDCISSWRSINNSCPLCRSTLDSNIIDIIYKKNSLLKNIGFESIHQYTIENQIGHQSMQIIKGQTPELSDEEKGFIFKITGFNIENKTEILSDDSILCIINGNIITIGKSKLTENNQYYLQDAIVITRQDGVTFPLHPPNRIYRNSDAKKIYLLV